MLTINGITVRLGGRTILDRATAAIRREPRRPDRAQRRGQIDADEGHHRPARSRRGRDRDAARTRLGYIAQEAPAATATPFDTVLAADTERAALMDEAEHCERPATGSATSTSGCSRSTPTARRRARRAILLGLGFDEEMQGRPLDSYSGGWKMRVALAALLFSEPDVLLLDEPSNHLDLEATLWLENFLKAYPGTLVVISHERDLLNNVVDTILHLEGGKITLYPGGYDSFERQRAERAAQLAAAKAPPGRAARAAAGLCRAQQRPRLDRQAGAVARQDAGQDAADRGDGRRSEPELRFPQPDRAAPAADHARHGRGRLCRDKPILQRLNLRIDPDDRIALLGRNGNGKTTLARLLAAQLAPMEGEMHASGKMQVGYFTQYQVEELHGDDTPLEHMTRAMEGRRPARSARSSAGSAFRATRRRRGRQAVGRRARAAGAGADHARRAAPADPRRADQPSRRRRARSAGPGAQRL